MITQVMPVALSPRFLPHRNEETPQRRTAVSKDSSFAKIFEDVINSPLPKFKSERISKRTNL